MTTDRLGTRRGGRSQKLAEQRSPGPLGQESELGHRAQDAGFPGQDAKAENEARGPQKEYRLLHTSGPRAPLVPEQRFRLVQEAKLRPDGGSLGAQEGDSIAGSHPG